MATGTQKDRGTQGTLRLQLVKSGIGFDRTQKGTLFGLGLRRREKIVEVKDTPAARGMVYKVRHLVKVLSEIDPTWRATLEAGVAVKAATPSRRPTVWKGVIVVPGPKTEPKEKKKEA